MGKCQNCGGPTEGDAIGCAGCTKILLIMYCGYRFKWRQSDEH